MGCANGTQDAGSRGRTAGAGAPMVAGPERKVAHGSAPLQLAAVRVADIGAEVAPFRARRRITRQAAIADVAARGVPVGRAARGGQLLLLLGGSHGIPRACTWVGGRPRARLAPHGGGGWWLLLRCRRSPGGAGGPAAAALRRRGSSSTWLLPRAARRVAAGAQPPGRAAPVAHPRRRPAATQATGAPQGPHAPGRTAAWEPRCARRASCSDDPRDHRRSQLRVSGTRLGKRTVSPRKYTLLATAVAKCSV